MLTYAELQNYLTSHNVDFTYFHLTSSRIAYTDKGSQKILHSHTYTNLTLEEAINCINLNATLAQPIPLPSDSLGNNIISKYSLALKTVQELTLPLGSVLRSVGIQQGLLMIYAETPSNYVALTSKKIHIYNTGEPFELPYTKLTFIGTAIDNFSAYHIYKEIHD